MDWFDEQIRKRRNSDERIINEAYDSVMNSILGEKFSFEEAEDSFFTILRYYKLPKVKIPQEISDDVEKLNIVCRLSGMMHRSVELEQGWYKNAFGAFLARIKDTGEYVAVIPNKFGKYCYYDHNRHKKIIIDKKTESLLEKEAISFSKPLPNKEMSIYELVKFGISSWSVSDHLFTYLLLGIATAIGLFIPKLNYFLYSTVLEEKSISLLFSTVFFIICIQISSMFLKTMQKMFTIKTSAKMDATVRGATMMRIMSLSPQFFRDNPSGELISRINSIETVCSSIVTMVFGTSLSSLFSLAYISQIMSFTPALLIPSLTVVVLNFLIIIYTTICQMRITRIQLEKAAENNDILLSMINGIQKIKTAGAENRMYARYAKSFSEEARVRYNPPFFIKINTVIPMAVALAGQLAIFYFTFDAGINPAEYFAFQSSFGIVMAAILTLSGIALEAAVLKPSLEMIKLILQEPPENNEKLQDIGTISGEIELNNLTFAYDESERNIIENFTVRFKKGDYVAIVGKTGCGKSTLIRLLLGFEKPQKGTIYYDGKDIQQIEKRSLRRKIGTVMQNDKLFNGDIYSNIVICAPHLSVAQAWEAAEIAGIADDIRQMPMGMNTQISEGSGGISGGQRQRIAIARAIAPKPKILIFDEATSALDNITQKKVSEALDKLDCTRIVVAHRLSTIRHCNRILVMDNGRIIEEGNYEELLAKKGYFSELVDRQRLDKNN